MLIKAILDIVEAEYEFSQRIPKSIQFIYEEILGSAENTGRTLEEFKKSLTA